MMFNRRGVAIGLLAVMTATPASALTIVPTYDSTVTNSGNLAQIQAAFNQAAAIYSALISENITVKISVGYGNYSYLGAAQDFVVNTFSYAQVRSLLLADADSAIYAASLPASLSTGPSAYWIPTAEYKALGHSVVSTFDGGIDAGESMRGANVLEA